MDILLPSVILALLMLLFFLFGMYVAIRTEERARENADYQYRKISSYHMAGVGKPGDPLPYVAPPVRRRRRIPHMKELEERLMNGGRGTVKVED